MISLNSVPCELYMLIIEVVMLFGKIIMESRPSVFSNYLEVKMDTIVINNT